MQPELAVERLHLGRLDQAGVRHRHGVEDSVQRLLPEGQKALQFREFRAEIVFLPEIGLEQPGVVRAPVEDVRRSQAITLHLAAEVTARHQVLHVAETQNTQANDSSIAG